MAVTPDWNVVGDALQEWIAADIRDAPKRIFVVAKFLFGVSVASIGVIVSIYKFLEEGWGNLESFALLALVVSAGTSLYLAIPYTLTLNKETNLVAKQNRIIKRARKFTLLWAAAWLLAVLLVAASLVGPIDCS